MIAVTSSLLTFSGLALLLGGALTRRRLATLVGGLPGGWTGWVAAGALLLSLGVALKIGSTLVTLGFTAPADVLAYLTSTTAGQAALTTLLGAAGVLGSQWWGGRTLLGWLAAAVTLWGVAGGGHGGVGGDPLMRAAHALHSGAMAAWVGGVLVLVNTKHASWTKAAQAFTPVALAGVVVLSLTGLYLGLHHAGSVQGWPTSGYGRTLLLKLALFGGVMVAALRVRRTFAPLAPDRPPRAALAVEAGLLLLVLVVTAVLVGSAPPR